MSNLEKKANALRVILPHLLAAAERQAPFERAMQNNPDLKSAYKRARSLREAINRVILPLHEQADITAFQIHERMTDAVDGASIGWHLKSVELLPQEVCRLQENITRLAEELPIFQEELTELQAVTAAAVVYVKAREEERRAEETLRVLWTTLRDNIRVLQRKIRDRRRSRRRSAATPK